MLLDCALGSSQVVKPSGHNHSHAFILFLLFFSFCVDLFPSENKCVWPCQSPLGKGQFLQAPIHLPTDNNYMNGTNNPSQALMYCVYILASLSSMTRVSLRSGCVDGISGNSFSFMFLPMVSPFS